MAKQIKAVRAGRPGSREFVLAGIGAVSLGRKQVQKGYRALVAEGSDARAVLLERAEQVRAQLGRRVLDAGTRLQPVIIDLRRRADAAAGVLASRVQPVLVRLGAAPATPVRSRKPAARGTRKPSTSTRRNSA